MITFQKVQPNIKIHLINEIHRITKQLNENEECKNQQVSGREKNKPQRDAHSTSELKRFLYFRISGASLSTITGAGATFTFTRELRRTRVDASDWLSSVRLVDRAAWLAEKPNMRKDRSDPRCWGCRGGVSILLTALQYYTNNIRICTVQFNVPLNTL